MGCDSTRDSVTARDIWRDTIYRVCITVTVAPARASLAQMTSTILALLLSLPPFANEPIPEPPAARFERLTTQAEAVWLASASRPPGVSRGQWVGALLALGWLESRFARYVGVDRCLDGPPDARCDPDEVTGIPRAKGHFQAHRAACPQLWTLPGGSVEWHRYAARCASGRLTGAYLRCRARAPSPLAGAFAGYRGADCEWGPSGRRARTALAFAARLGA